MRVAVTSSCLQDKHGWLSTPDPQPCAAAGDQWAALYRAHRAAVYARCRRLLGEKAAAEDAAHELFARAFVHLPELADRGYQRRWLLKAARNYCLNQLRDRRRQFELLGQWGMDTNDSVTPGYGAQAVATWEMAEWATRRVPESVRRVAWLTYVDDMRQAEVAKRLGISRRTVVNRLAAFRFGVRRAMDRLEERESARWRGQG